MLILGKCPECGSGKLYVEAGLDERGDIRSLCRVCGERWDFPIKIVMAMQDVVKETGAKRVAWYETPEKLRS